MRGFGCCLALSNEEEVDAALITIKKALQFKMKQPVFRALSAALWITNMTYAAKFYLHLSPNTL